MQITYREMVDSDREQILQLFYEFCELYRDTDAQNIYIISKKLAEWSLDDMMKEIQKTEGQVIVAESDGQVIGFIGFLINKSHGDEHLYYRPHTYGSIYNLYIFAKYRNNQIGTHLLELAEDYFRKHNCEFSKLHVFGANTKAQNFYYRNKYSPRNIELIKKL